MGMLGRALKKAGPADILIFLGAAVNLIVISGLVLLFLLS
jgi:hypothetical protein